MRNKISSGMYLFIFVASIAFAASESDRDREKRLAAESAYANREIARMETVPISISALPINQVSNIYRTVCSGYWIFTDGTLLSVYDESIKKHQLTRIYPTISGIVGGDSYLIDDNQAMLVVPGQNGLVNGAYVPGYAISEGTYEYITLPSHSMLFRPFMSQIL